MNILQVLPELNVGGVERGTVDLAKYLVRQGHKAVVVSNGGDLVQDLQSLGAVHYVLPVNAKNIFTMVRAVPLLADIIRKEKIDIVHARSRVPAWIAYFACRRTRTPFVTTCHGYYKKHAFSSVMGWGKKVIVLSNVIARHMIEDFGVPRDRIRLIPRSVDMEKFRYRPVDPRASKAEFHVGIIGRLTPIKGHLYFIKAMAKVVREFPNVRVWIVGDAPSSKDAYKEQLRVLVRRLGLWENTQFLGTQKDIPDILSQLDLLVLATTTQEAFGRVVIEAQAAGVPVVATGVGGVVDIIEDGVNGLLVPPADPQLMAEAVLRLLRDRSLAAELAEEAYKKVRERYTLERMAKNTLDVYEEVLRNSRILVVKLSSLGDIILSTAAFKALRARFPRPAFRITVLVSQEFCDVLQRCPYIDELITCDFKNRDAGLRGFLKLATSLRKRHFDVSIDLQNSRKSHLLCALAFAPDRFGYARKLGFLLNKAIKDTAKGIDPVSHQFRVLEGLGVEKKDAALELWPGPGDEAEVTDFLKSHWVDSNRPLVGINFGASRRWESKVWPRQHLARLCVELAKRDIRVVITGTRDDAPAADSFIAGLSQVKPVNSCGRFSLNQLACLIRKCGVFISGDSAPLHVAAAVSTPIVALFGPTDPCRHLPPAGKCIMLRKELECSPCYKSKCPKGRCMAAITPEEVLASVETLLKK